MPRPQTKGEMIAVRLPLDTDSYIRVRAEAHGETPADYIARRLVDAHERSLPPVASDDCAHLHAPLGAANLPVCTACGAVQGRDEVWRLTGA